MPYMCQFISVYFNEYVFVHERYTTQACMTQIGLISEDKPRVLKDSQISGL